MSDYETCFYCVIEHPADMLYSLATGSELYCPVCIGEIIGHASERGMHPVYCPCRNF